jgi:hypothetical protein
MPTESHTRAASNGQREEKAGTALKRAAGRLASDDDDDVRSRVRGAVDEVTRSLDLKGRVERNPYGTLAAALGVGYVLGGGFFTPLTGRLVSLGFKLGIRLAVLPLLNDQIANIVSDALGGSGGNSAGSDSDSSDEGGGKRRSKNTGREGT